jgi:hypothetical protein
MIPRQHDAPIGRRQHVTADATGHVDPAMRFGSG